MKKTRQVGAIDGKGQFVVIEEAIPEPKQNEVLVEVKASLMSPGTEFLDIPELRKNPDPKLKPEDKKFGYGSAGIIMKQGPGCEDMPIGQKVSCMGWGYALHTDFAVIPRNLVLPMPEGMTYDQAAFAHLGATGMMAVRRAELEFAENVMVVGCGPVGQCTLQIAVASGTHVIAVDRLPMRLEVAKKSGAEITVNTKEEKMEDMVEKIKNFTRGFGVDCSIVVCGGDITDIFQLITKTHKTAPDHHIMGRTVIPGVASFSFPGILWPTFVGNMDIRPSSRPGPGYKDAEYEHGKNYAQTLVPWTTRRNLEEFLRFISLKKIDVDKMITHRLPFKDFSKGVEKLYTSPNEALGVIFYYNQ